MSIVQDIGYNIDVIVLAQPEIARGESSIECEIINNIIYLTLRAYIVKKANRTPIKSPSGYADICMQNY